MSSNKKEIDQETKNKNIKSNKQESPNPFSQDSHKHFGGGRPTPNMADDPVLSSIHLAIQENLKTAYKMKCLEFGVTCSEAFEDFVQDFITKNKYPKKKKKKINYFKENFEQ